MPIFCLKCGRPMNCFLSTAVHVLTEHERRDLCIPPTLISAEDGKSCLSCMLEGSMPIEKLWKAKGII